MEISVEIMGWGALEASGCAHGWLCIGRLFNPKSLDLSYLKPMAMDIMKKKRRILSTPMMRLVFRKDGREYMKLDMYDL